MKKILALALAAVMVIGMMSIASAGTLTITRDSSYAGDSGDREYTWYKVFDVTPITNAPSGGGVADDGTPGSITNTITTAAYTADSTVAAKLDDATLSPANTWFTTTAIAGSTDKAVAWNTTVTEENAANTQAAAKWLVEKGAYTSSGTFTASGSSFTTSTNFDAGYYVIVPSEGDNYIALTLGTGNTTIAEKNKYPTIDKKQTTTSGGTYGDDDVGVKIGDKIYYQVEVKVPADANRDIIVTDTMSTGLAFDDNVVVTVGTTVPGTAIDNTSNANYEAAVKGGSDTWTWKYTIHPTDAIVGKYVVFTFSGTVTADALTSISRQNDVELDYNNGHYIETDHVEFDIGAAAIIKYDGATATESSGVLTPTGTSITYLTASFALTDSTGAAVKVSEATSGTVGVYVVDPEGASNEVTSDKDHDGVILIYGLDPDETYTLTETDTEAGYNLLAGTVSLAPVKAENTDVNTIKVVLANVDEIVAGNTSADAANTLTLTAADVVKVANNSGTVLPSTGGIGTTIFYVSGLLMVLGAATILISRRRADAE